MRVKISRAFRQGVAIAAIACAVVGVERGNAQETALSVATFTNNVLSLPYYVAEQEGFFKAKDLKVSLVAVQTGPAAGALVAGGTVDIGQMGADTLLSLLDKGQNFKVLAGFQKSDLEVAIAKDSAAYAAGARKLGDLKGATIGVPVRAGLVERFISVLLSEAGLDPAKDVTFLAVGAVPTQVAALKAKRVDAVGGTVSMNIQIGSNGIDLASLANSAIGQGGPIGSAIVFNVPAVRPETATAKAEALGRYCQAMASTIAWIKAKENGAKYLAHAKEWLKMQDAQMVKAAAEPLRDLLVGAMTEDIWNKQLSIMPQFKTPFAEVTFGPCAKI